MDRFYVVSFGLVAAALVVALMVATATMGIHAIESVLDRRRELASAVAAGVPNDLTGVGDDRCVPQLIRPTVEVHKSWLEALDEPGYDPTWAEFLDVERLRDESAFAAYVASQLAEADEDAPRPTGWVPATYLWFVDGEEFLGRLSIRHRLTPWLRDYGGHVGYDVRPSARRRGHASAMLQQSLPWCQDLGIDPVLVTCDIDNVASRRVIEKAGGQFEDRRDGKLRFWVPAGTI